MRDLARVAFPLTAVGTVSVPLTDIDALRANPGLAGDRAHLAKFLRNADEETVAGVAALLSAVASRGWGERSFADWGIIGCPRFIGRMIISGLLTRFFSDPKYSLSPHVIPNYCLHSTSGTASVTLGLHGPNFGVGGGPNQLPEGLLTAVSVLAEGRLPGLWLLLSEFDPEPRPDDAGKPANAVAVHAVALGFAPDRERIGSLRLITPAVYGPDPAACGFALTDLIAYLNGESQESPWSCPVEGLGTLELSLEKHANG